jgi:ADP-heptose:LPS heptosyltransferase
MDIELQRRIDRYVGVPVCRFLSLLSKFRRVPHGVRPKNILVVLLSEMGSLVLAQPMFRHLRRVYPEATFYALIFKQNQDVLDVLDLIPKENILTLRSGSYSELTTDSLRTIRKMRTLGIDTVLDCELFSRVSSIFAYLSGAAFRVGFHPHTQEGLYRGSFINRPVLYNPHQHIARQFLTLAESIEATGRPGVKRPTGEDDLHIESMTVDGEEVAALRSRIESDFPFIKSKRLVLVNPGGGLLPIRAWPIESYSYLARALVQRGYAVGITGMERDRELARRIRGVCESDSCVDLTGYTATVRELMVLFHLSALLITNDGGPGHFASMTPIPSIVFYGPETPALYGPLDEKSTSFFAGLSCSPCLTAYNHRKSPCDGDNRCLKHIDSDAVLKRSLEILESETD